MLTQIFKAFVVTSGLGSVLAAVFVAVKPLTKKYFSGNWNYYIWIVVLIVMMFPVKITIPANQSPPAQSIQQTILLDGVKMVSVMSNSAPAVQRWNQSLIGTMLDNKLELICLLWILGTILLFCFSIFSYIMLLWKIHKNSTIISCPELTMFTGKKITVLQGEYFSSPFMTGIIKPTLFLPDIKMTPEERKNILRHEITHFKRRDIWYKWFAMIVKCIHWFNPVIYFVVRQISMECEISCDLAVVSNMNQEEERSYINTILSVLSHNSKKNIFLTIKMADSKEQIKRRFIMIKNRTKTSRITKVLSTVLAFALLTTTIFTGGVLANAAGIYNNQDINVSKFGERILLVNKPYIENETLYLPLKETLSHFIDLSEGVSTISWEEEKKEEVLLHLFDKEHTRVRENGDTVYVNLYYYKLKIGMPYVYGANEITDTLKASPVLKNGVTYVPAEVFEIIKDESGLLNGFNVCY